MKSFMGLIVAGMVATTMAMPANDKYNDKHDDKWDDHKDTQKYEHDDGKGEWKDHGVSSFPFHFTSTLYAKATPDTIINNDGESVPGQKGAVGYYSFGLNSWEEVICYNITLVGVSGDYQSPAKTATHIHEAPAGKAGPPRLAFPNPWGDEWKRTSYGCLQGPFTTGLEGPNGEDTGKGFSLKELEANPSGFFADVHTKQYLAGAVRGQLQKKDW